MSSAWLIVVLSAITTMAIKAAGPVLVGGRELPRSLSPVIGLLAPALLAALVAINTLGTDRALTVDARVLGVAAAAVAIWRRAPLLVVLVVAAGVTAAARSLG